LKGWIAILKAVMASDARIDDLLSIWDAAPVKPQLEELCRSCPDLLDPLRQRVRALQDADRMLDTGLLARTGLDRPPPISDPEQIGQYRILGKIGEGGMGVVYRAEQREPVRRMVALKLIKLGMDSREVVARFEAERQALALMNHPNVAKVLEAGITDTGRPYFAMELVQGIDFIRYCEDEKLIVRQRIELFIPVCQAVQHAHQKGIIHRDLKPSNILVQLIDGKPVPKVIDFGIAKAINQVLTQHTLFTQTGAMIGTPEYMSPEQAMTSGLDVDTRTDVYSLGVILYQLLTDSLPLDPKALREAGLEGMARLIKNVEPQKPSTRLLKRAATAPSDATSGQIRTTRLLHKELQDDLDWIVLKAMEKDRSRRYETANALAIDLERHLDGQTVLARPPSTLYRVQKFVSKHRLPVAAGAAVMLALVIAVVSVTWGLVHVKQERDVAKAASIVAVEKAQLAATNEAKANQYAANADGSAKRADANAAKAELRLADVHVAQADALTIANRVADARKLYHEAIVEFGQNKQSPFRGEVGLSIADLKSPPPLLTLKGHADSVYSVAFSPDGRFALSGSRDQYLTRWDLQTGRAARSKREFYVTGVAFGADEKTAFAVGLSGRVKLLDLKDGSELRPKFRVATDARNFTFGADGRYVLVRRPESCEVWNVNGGDLIGKLLAVRDDVTCTSISSDGRRLLFGTNGKGVELLKIGDLESSLNLPMDDPVHSIAFSPTGDYAIVGSGDHALQILDIGKRTLTRSLQGHTGKINCVAFSPDGQTALSGSDDHTVRLWNWRDGGEICSFHGHSEAVLSVTFSPDGRTALSGGADGVVVLWPIPPAARTDIFDSGNQVSNVAISADARMALAGRSDGTATLWDTPTGSVLRTFHANAGPIECVALSSDGRTALTGDSSGNLLLWDTEKKIGPRPLGGTSESIYAIAISPDGKAAISGGEGTVSYWDLGAGRKIKSFEGHGGPVTAVAFSSSGRLVLSGSGSSTGMLLLHDLSQPKNAPRVFPGSFGGICGMAFAPDGRTALTGNRDKLLHLWDVEACKEIARFEGHTNIVAGVAFGPDGRTAFSGSWDKTARMWDIGTGKEVRVLAEGIEPISSVAFGGDAMTLVSASAQVSEIHRIRAWDFSRGQSLTQLENSVQKAIETLETCPLDATSLGTLGEWYAFRGKYDWAVELLNQSHDGGKDVDALLLARCYWALSSEFPKTRDSYLAAAGREYQRALSDAKGSDAFYLNLCASAVQDGNDK
jgi:WD40 repeat protein/serine/threonine protein kinase